MRAAAFDAQVERLRREYFGTTGASFLPKLQKGIQRRLGLDPLGRGAMMLAGLIGAGIRLSIALLASALFGELAEIPWGRWAVVLVVFFAMEADNAWALLPLDVEPPKRYRRFMEDWTALLPAIVREADVRELADFTRRWLRLPVIVAAGVAVAAIMLLAGILIAPAALGELPAGSIVLLAWVLFDFGVGPVYWGNLFNRAFTAREARFDHHLFWPSPADSPEVRKVMGKTLQSFAAGMYTTVALVMTVVLVGWNSPLVVPLAVGFVVIGYLTTIALAFGNRASVRRIIERSRRQRLALFRSRIDAFEPRIADLSPEESEQLRSLLFLHDRIRDAPSSPTSTHTAVRTAAGLLIPTIAFIITVFGEVSAERIIDAVLP